MDSTQRWLIGGMCIVAGFLFALGSRSQRPVGVVESLHSEPGEKRLEAEASGGLAREMARSILAQRGAADSRQVAVPLAIDRVFADPAVERARHGKFPPERVIVTDFIRPVGAYDVLIRDADPGRLPHTILVSEWWNEDFYARHGGAATPDATQLQRTPADTQWVEDDTRFSLDPMMKIDRLNLNGAVIDKEAEAPFAGDMTDNQGAMVEAGYFVVFNRIEPFLRYEWPGPEPDALDGPVSSMGVNYYLVPSRMRFSVSTVFTSPGQAGAGSAGHFDRGGLVRDGSRDESSVRAQFQLLF